jgi:hypothetical protein
MALDQERLKRKHLQKAQPVYSSHGDVRKFKTSPQGWAGLRGNRDDSEAHSSVAEYTRRGYRYIPWDGR